ncbi:type II toxin-antitoxin system VapC family toxin [Methanobrevibacter sp.]|uniref:type II toxin-antitoxin system VapC family toxin n=1 Tax=Methanobrevibacter sp. TaxID=66852 RepID=UPI0026E107C8|nr:type II toxin-antitoxin system VapC family toxin [Methanobrevibacter sp.]MDO5860791.1 type II toxin-antitoxin system VapC family toxin [Methanobrevibacter sp.]
MIFLDSSYLKGLIDEKDSFHKKALIVRDEIGEYNELTVINTTVLVETLNFTAKTNSLAGEVYNELKCNNKIVSLTFEDYINSLNLNRWYGNSINYSDCTIINTMFGLGINKIATFDSDFSKIKGINILQSTLVV